MSVVVTTSKFCGGYINSFTGVISPDGGQLLVKVYDSPNNGIATSPPATGSFQIFNFNGQFKFEGVVRTIVRRPETSSEPQSYDFVLACNDIISNYSDTIAGLSVYNINATYVAKVVGNTAGQRSELLLSIGAFVDIQAYIYGIDTPNSNYGTVFDWRTYPLSDAFFLNDAIYRSYIPYSQNAPNGNPMYVVDGKIPQSAEGISISPTSANPPATTNPNADTSPPVTVVVAGSTGATTTTTQTNDYGAGSVITTYPNNGTVPTGTTVTTSSSDGLIFTKTIYANSSEVTETTLTTFSPSRNVASQNIAQKQQAFNQPASFQGSIDPTKLFPSVEIYPSSTYSGKDSGVFFGKSASPTSFDLDPYFYFSKNDYGLVAKDGKSNSKNINVKKDAIKDHVRTMGLKGPMYYSGWGYDTRGLPVPNAANQIVQTGVGVNKQPLYGTDVNGSYKFHEKTPIERNLWKTGPVDLRWHDKRKTWVGGHEMLEGYLTSALAAPEKQGVTTAKMAVLRIASPTGLIGQNLLASPAVDLKDSEGKVTGVRPAIYTNEFISVSNRDPSLSASSGAYCMVVDINYEWRPIYIGC